MSTLDPLALSLIHISAHLASFGGSWLPAPAALLGALVNVATRGVTVGTAHVNLVIQLGEEGLGIHGGATLSLIHI